MYPKAITVVTPAHSYWRRAPNVVRLTADPRLLDRMLDLLSCFVAGAPDEGYIDLEGCFLFDGKFVLREDGHWINESLLDLDRDPRELDEAQERTLRDDFISFAATDGRQNVLLCKSGAQNFGHFLTDILPKLVNVKKSGMGPVRLHMTASSMTFADIINDTCQALEIDAIAELWEELTLVRFDRALFFTPISAHPFRKSRTFLELRDLLLSLHGSQSKLKRAAHPEDTAQPGDMTHPKDAAQPENMANSEKTTSPKRKLLIMRMASEYRHFLEEDAVKACFEARGFEAIHPLQRSTAENIELFSQATHVAGAWGAGLVNAAFAGSNCEILEFDPGVGDAYFWDLASLVGQKFHWYFTEPLQPFHPDLWRRAISLDIGELNEFLDSIGW